MPNIQLYEAQDLVAASFLAQYAKPDSRGIDPAEAKQAACQRWFGSSDGRGAPNPPNPNDRLIICALAQMDLYFDAVKIAPMYTYDEAMARCREKGGAAYSPCFGCEPLPPGA